MASNLLGPLHLLATKDGWDEWGPSKLKQSLKAAITLHEVIATFEDCFGSGGPHSSTWDVHQVEASKNYAVPCKEQSVLMEIYNLGHLGSGDFSLGGHSPLMEAEYYTIEQDFSSITCLGKQCWDQAMLQELASCCIGLRFILIWTSCLLQSFVE